MKNVKQASKFKLLNTLLLVSFIMLLLSSCTKNLAEIAGISEAEVNAVSQSSPDKSNNSLVSIPFEENLFVPCANGGTGEFVALSGTTNFVYQMIWNDHAFHLVYHTNSHGIAGVGLSSGELFIGSDGTEGSAKGSWVNNQWIGNTIEQIKIIGKNTKYIVRYKYHLIVTPDGNITVSIIDKTSDCIQ